MPITVTCACGSSYPIREEFAGQRVKCPSCGQMLTIPGTIRRAPQPKFDRLEVVDDDTIDVEEVSDDLEDGPAPRRSGLWVLLGVLTLLLLFCGGLGAAAVAFFVLFKPESTAAGATLPAESATPSTAAPSAPPVTAPLRPAVPLPPLPSLPGPSSQPFDGHEAPINAIAFSRDGSIALTAAGGSELLGQKPELLADNTVRVWDVKTGKEQRRARNFRDGITAAAFSPDGRLAVLAGLGRWDAGAWSPAADATLHLWDVQRDEEVGVFTGHTKRVFCVAFSADGKRVVSGSADHTVRLWNVENFKQEKRFEGHTNSVTSVALSPDGRYVLSGSADKTVRLWDAANGTIRHVLSGHKDIVWAVAFAPGGKLAASAGGMQPAPDGRGFIDGDRDYDIRLWDVETVAEVRRFHGHTKAVGCLAFSRDGRRLLSGASDNTVRLWPVAGGSELAVFEGHKDVPRAVDFFADGRLALSGGDDRVLRVWNVPPDLSDVLAQLDDADPKTRLEAARQLPAYGAEVRPSLAALVKALERDDPEFRAAVLTVLTKLGPPTRSDPVSLVPLFNDRSFPAGRLYALEGLAALGADYAPTLPALKEALQDKDTAVKRKAVQLAGQLGASGRPTLYPVLVAMLTDDDELSKEAGNSLAKMGKPTESELPQLNDLLRNTKAGVRRYALIALTEMGTDAAKALPRVREVLTIDKEAELRGLALVAASKIEKDKKEIAELMKRGLLDADENVSKQAVAVLAALAPDPNALSVLLEALGNKNAAVARAAEEVLPKVTFDKTHVKGLIAALRASKSDAVRLKLMSPLVALQPDTADAGAALGDFLKDARGPTRAKVVTAIGDLGNAGRDAGPALAALLKDDDTALRFEAALALCKTRSQESEQAVPQLVAALRLEKLEDKEGLERQDKAHKALVALGKPAVDALGSALEKDFFGGSPRTGQGATKANARLAVIKTLELIGGDAKGATRALGSTEKEDPVQANRVAARQARLKIQKEADQE